MNRTIFAAAVVIALLVGGATGYQLGAITAAEAGREAPENWIARVGDRFITQSTFEDEMRRRSGGRPGQFQSLEQREALLDELVFQRAMVNRAEALELDQDPAVERSLNQIVINRLIQSELRPRQERSAVDPAAIEAYFNEHADEFSIPARRRVAMVQFELGAGASPQTRQDAFDRAHQAREQALQADESTRDFGGVARDFSDHQSSRYRGGVLGWISEGDIARYSHPAPVLEAANAMTQAGEISGVIEGEDALYLVRLVDYQPRRTRTLEELSDGISQRLLRDRFNEVEQAFRAEILAASDVEVKTRLLEQITPEGSGDAADPRSGPPPIPGVGAEEEQG